VKIGKYIATFRRTLQLAAAIFRIVSNSLPIEEYYIRCVVITAVNIKVSVSWGVTPCNLVDMYQSFETTCYIHFQGRSIAMHNLHTHTHTHTLRYLRFRA
jgi:hypothetical protein